MILSGDICQCAQIIRTYSAAFRVYQTGAVSENPRRICLRGQLTVDVDRIGNVAGHTLGLAQPPYIGPHR
ncbi:hypothetical protein C8259_33150 [Nocardia nova]|uniref:Uncharacterized protein n=1 Tax=Nocardia nova TaxID=37330 RepID=A0A2T2YQS4_9NOCA|nr:hypothetical protein C8259_33150 [Nocardia nova]